MSVCRLCAETVTEFTSIFSRRQEKTVADMVQQVTAIEVPIDDPYSVLVCPDCIEATLDAFNYIKRVREAEQRFREVEQGVVVIDDDDKSVEMVDYGVFDADGVDLMDHSATTMPNRKLLDLGDGSVEIVELEPEEASKDLLKLFVGSIHHEGSDKWYKLKSDRDFSELMTGSVELFEEEEGFEEEDEENEQAKLVRNEVNIARCCNRKCKAVFRTRQELIQHGAKVHGEDREETNAADPFECLVCFRRFETRRALVGHMRLMIRDYRCHVCDIFFNTPLEQDAHIKSSHLGDFGPGRRYRIEEQPIKICCGCEAKFDTMEELIQHGIDVHKAAAASSNRIDREQECNVCYKLFKTREGLRNHQVGVYRAKRFICGICSKTFETSSKFINHRVSHKNDRNFACETCHGRFRTATDLRHHLRTHEERKLVCSTCGARFRTAAHLRTHLKVHDANAYEFTCEYCSKQFKHKGSWKAHIQLHRNERPFQCQHCGHKFSRSTRLYLHLQKVCERVD